MVQLSGALLLVESLPVGLLLVELLLAELLLEELLLVQLTPCSRCGL